MRSILSWALRVVFDVSRQRSGPIFMTLQDVTSMLSRNFRHQLPNDLAPPSQEKEELTPPPKNLSVTTDISHITNTEVDSTSLSLVSASI